MSGTFCRHHSTKIRPICMNGQLISPSNLTNRNRLQLLLNYLMPQMASLSALGMSMHIEINQTISLSLVACQHVALEFYRRHGTLSRCTFFLFPATGTGKSVIRGNREENKSPSQFDGGINEAARSGVHDKMTWKCQQIRERRKMGSERGQRAPVESDPSLLGKRQGDNDLLKGY